MASWFNKWLVITFLPACLYINGNEAADFVHPLHMSVVEVNHNEQEKVVEITCKLFRDDFEKVLIKNNKTRVDLINPPNRSSMESLVNNYIYQHLRIKADGKQLQLAGIGFEFERDEDAVYAYFQVEKLNSVKNIQVTNNIMHDLFDDQQNIMHVIVRGERQSFKLDYPKTEASFTF